MNRAAKQRALFVCCLLAAVFTVFSAKLIQLQVSEHAVYVRDDASHKEIKQPIYARRGMITDVNYESLAQNEPTRRVLADGSLIKDHSTVAEILAGPLGRKKSDLIEKLKRTKISETTGVAIPSRYIVLQKDVPETNAEQIADAMNEQKQRGIFFEPDSIRRYPNNALLAHVIGYTDGANSGVDGIEKTMDEYLRGHDGYRFVEHDREGRELVLYRGQERAARNGCKVRLTIDMQLQNIVEIELDTAMKQFKPNFAVCVMIRPQTGEILAMASRPNFNPNDINSIPEKVRIDPLTSPLINRAIASSYEPGSTFKIVATTAALNERLVKPETMIFCENGYFPRYKLKDSHPHADLSVSEVLVKSSNIGVCKLAVQLGEQKFYEYVRRFGFGDQTGVGLPHEENGILAPPYRWSKISISRLPMGQEINVTALQITAAMSAIANGGNLMMPQIIRDVTDENDNVLRTLTPTVVRRVAGEEAVRSVRDALVQAVGPKGTAPLAHVSGFKVGGKTGTAQVLEGQGKGYSHDRHRTSFVGFMPAEAPEFTCLVMIDEPETEHRKDMGGLVCAPIFSRIAERAARYMNLTPDPEATPYGTELSLNGKPHAR
jgi:cell division protein FtsI (penicillin-binding protein 3)/stage V sporulation protein D (sporulation-specific penicillin-binding protein)